MEDLKDILPELERTPITDWEFQICPERYKDEYVSLLEKLRTALNDELKAGKIETSKADDEGLRPGISLVHKHWIYVLRLEDGYYYVGFTTNLPRRILQHGLGIGAVWTALHRPEQVIEVIENGSERDTTLRYMLEKGIEKVRGAEYIRETLSEETVSEIESEFFRFDPLWRAKAMDKVISQLTGKTLTS